MLQAENLGAINTDNNSNEVVNRIKFLSTHTVVC